MSDKDGCSKSCSKPPGHHVLEGDEAHMCNVAVHRCGEECTLDGCGNRCIEPFSTAHERHVCRVLACPHDCPMPGCNNKCSETNNHFHAIDAAASGQNQTHMCGDSHRCAEKCDNPGVCELISHRVVREEVYETKFGQKIRYEEVSCYYIL